MAKKTTAEKNENNLRILLSLLGETEEENKSQEEKDGIKLNGIFVEFEEEND